MSEKSLQSKAQRFNHLTRVLNQYACVRRYDVPGEPQAATLAHAFCDLEDSFRAILETHLPKIAQGDLTDE